MYRSFFWENLRIALGELWSHKTRTLLTGIGIVIGIVAVSLMSTLINGVDKLFEKSMEFLGNDVLYIDRWEWFGNEDWWTMRNRPRIDLDDAEAIRERSDYALVVATERMRSADLSYRERSAEGISVHGVSANYMDVSNMDIAKGRFFTASEDRTGSQIVLLGSEVAEKLFPNENPLEKTIMAGNIHFRVVGVLQEMGKFMGAFSMDTQIIIPVETFNKIFEGPWGMRRITVRVPQEYMEQAKEELRGEVGVLRGEG